MSIFRHAVERRVDAERSVFTMTCCDKAEVQLACGGGGGTQGVYFAN